MTQLIVAVELLWLYTIFIIQNSLISLQIMKVFMFYIYLYVVWEDVRVVPDEATCDRTMNLTPGPQIRPFIYCFGDLQN